MDKKDMFTIASDVLAGTASVIVIVLAYKEYKTTMNDHERIEHLENTVHWMVQSDLDIQKESDQSKN